jgi:uncharacterized protein YdaU (DUF1376 family)
MARAPWMPFYVADYLGDTEHLSTIQHGAYCLLLFSYWRRGGLPNNDQQLANITKMTLAEWLEHRSTLKAFFYDNWKHKRIETELRRSMEKIAKAKVAGQKGGLTSAMNREKMKYTLQRLR